MNRLAVIKPDNRSTLRIVLDHLQDAHPEEWETAWNHIDDRSVSPTNLARALTKIAEDDNLRAGDGKHIVVDEKAIRRERERNSR